MNSAAPTLTEEIELLASHLSRRCHTDTGRRQFVLDITPYCNLRCSACGVNAIPLTNSNHHKQNLGDIEIIQKIVADILSICHNSQSIKLAIGGGEPFTRQDVIETIHEIRHQLPNAYISIDSNGTLITDDHIKTITPIIDNLGISIDGLEETHNRNRLSKLVNTPFADSMNTVERILQQGYGDKLEVTTIATKANLSEIPFLAAALAEKGVLKFSIHRAIPVGRMSKQSRKLTPSAADYIKLYAETIKSTRRFKNFSFHMHHTLEAIYSAIFLQKDTLTAAPWNGNTNDRSSLGINHSGQVFVDPWLMFDRTGKLSLGSLTETPLMQILSSSNSRFKSFSDPTFLSSRCDHCSIKCSGGSRVCAISTSIKSINDITFEEYEKHYSAKDPACPINCEGIIDA
jgi:MoaA/NifB/PqqE/SkfB family radical SAM enzyme